MVKAVTKMGDTDVLIVDSGMLAQAHLKVGDQVEVSIQDGGSILLTPIKATIGTGEAAAMAKDLIQKNAELFKRLS
jgi:antitoxin component of MazEF toxin-antitoxin module